MTERGETQSSGGGRRSASTGRALSERERARGDRGAERGVVGRDVCDAAWRQRRPHADCAQEVTPPPARRFLRARARGRGAWHSKPRVARGVARARARAMPSRSHGKPGKQQTKTPPEVKCGFALARSGYAQYPAYFGRAFVWLGFRRMQSNFPRAGRPVGHSSKCVCEIGLRSAPKGSATLRAAGEGHFGAVGHA